MKLVELYISGFGALSDYPLSFNDTLTCVLEENGFGKTTLAAFIKAMFYSLPPARKGQTADKNERVKYLPWNSSSFGGRLTFEANGKTYTAIRNFDSQSITKDSFQLVDAKSGKPSEDFSEKLGEELFGIDEEGFFRSTFSNGVPSLSSLPASVRSKISSETGVAEDLGEFEIAEKTLSKSIKAIGSKGGSLDKNSQKMSEDKLSLETCRVTLSQYEQTNQKIEQLDAEYNVLVSEKNRIDKSLAAALGAEASKIKLENYNKLSNEITDLKRRLEEIEKTYGGKCPDEQILSEIYSKTEALKTKTALLASEMQKTQTEQFKQVFERFKDNMPSDEQMDKLSKAVRTADLAEQKLNSLRGEIEEFEGELAACHLQSLEDVPSDAELVQMRALAGRVASATVLSNQSSAKKMGALPFVLAAALIVVGIGLLFVNTIAGIAVAAVGAVALIAVGLLAAVKKTVSAGLGSQTVSLEDRQNLTSFLSKFGFSSDVDVNLAIDKLKKAAELMDQIKENKNLVELEIQVLSEAKSFVDAASYRFNILADNTNGKYEKLKKQRDFYLEVVLPSVDNIEHLKFDTQTAERDIRALFAQIGVADLGEYSFSAMLEMVKRDASDYKNGIKMLNAKLSEAEESFERDNISQIATEQSFGSIEELKTKKARLEDKAQELGAELAALRAKANRLESARGEMNQLSEEIENGAEFEKEEKQKLATLTKTLEFLTSAKTALAHKYAGGIEDNFKKYSEKFLSKSAETVSVDSDLALSVKKNGIAREPEFFSSGQRSVMDVCLRLSLVDSMFEKQKPFVILDDPFSLMDNQNLKDALALVKSASKDKQIIYLTCHESREIK